MRVDLLRRITENPRRWLLLAVLIYVVVFSIYSLLRYYSFRTLFYDLGITTYSMNRVLRGDEGLQTLILPSTFGHIGHFSPILILPLGLYALLPYPETLLVLQSLLLGLAALPLFRLGEMVLGRRDQALLIALAYLAYPALHGVNRYDFHVEAFIPLLGFVVIIALLQDRFWTFMAASAALLTTHEFVSAIYLFTGGVLLLHRHFLKSEPLRGQLRRRYSLALFLLGLAVLALSEALTRLMSTGGRSLLGWLVKDPGVPGSPYPVLSMGPTELDLLGKLAYWFVLLAPLMLLPLRKWRVAIPVVPWLGVSLLAARVPFYSIYYQYPAFVIAPLFFSALWALRYSKRLAFLPKRLRNTPAMVLGGTLLLASVFSVLSPLNAFDGLTGQYNALGGYPPAVTPHDVMTSRLLGQIPLDARVVAQNELFTQVGNRREVALSWDPAKAAPPDYVAVDISRHFFWSSPDPRFPPLSRQLPTLLSTHGYRLVCFSDSTFVYGLGPGKIAFTVGQGAMPSSQEEFRRTWSSSGGTTTYGPEGIGLQPDGLTPGFVWTKLSEPLKSGRFDFRLDVGDPADPMGWSGLLLNFRSGTNYSVVYFLPSLGQVRYAKVEAGNVTYLLVGNYTGAQARIPAQVLWSGGSVQVWVDGVSFGFAYPRDPAPLETIGFVASVVGIRASDLSIYRSTADQPPPSEEIPWGGIVAFTAIVVPVMSFVACQDWILERVRRVITPGHGPRNHRSG